MNSGEIITEVTPDWLLSLFPVRSGLPKVDYNGATQLLKVRLSEANIRPGTTILSVTRNLVAELGSLNAFVGFTSGEALHEPFMMC